MKSGAVQLLINSGWDTGRAARRITGHFGSVTSESELERTASKLAIAAPKGKTIDGRISRAKLDRYWRKHLGPSWLRYREQQNRKSGYVGRSKGYALSDPIYELKRLRDASNRVMLEEDLIAISDHGDVEPVAKLSDRTVSNPKNRRAELMTRISGDEAYAVSQGFVATFVTLTLPGLWHPVFEKTGTLNPEYNGSDPIEANRWFTKRWARCRAALKDLDLKHYGLRVVEPHHDGTPHWHLVLFCNPSQLHALKEQFQKQFSRGHSHPHIGIKFLDADPKKGSAAAYMAKYVSKNIDGEGLEPSEKQRASRVVAWARVWGFRQFDQIGGPPVGIWRELRKLCSEEAVPGDMVDAWQAANASDWCKFIEAMGGPFAGRNYPIKLKRGYKVGINGEATPPTNQYGEPLVAEGWDMRPVVGLMTESCSIKTYEKFWVIEQRDSLDSSLEPEGRIGPWTRDNNCSLIPSEASARTRSERFILLSSTTDRAQDRSVHQYSNVCCDTS